MKGFLYFPIFLVLYILFFGTKLSAGQISVINPASGSSVAGVVNIVVVPNGVSNSPANLDFSQSQSNSNIIVRAQNRRLAGILALLKRIDVKTFSKNETLEVIGIIDRALENKNMNSFVLETLQQELIKLKHNLE